MLKKLVVFLCIAMFAATGTAWSAAPPQSASGKIVMQFDLSAQPAGQEAKLWIPYPVSDRDQDISAISYSGDYAEAGVYADKKFANPILYARWDKNATSRKLTLEFTATRQEVAKRNLPSHEGAWNRADFQQWLSATSLGPIDGKVKELADKITAGKNGVLQKAKAIYAWTCDNMYRDPATVGCGTGDVNALLQRPGGKCTDIHSVFVALCRAAGVPAREVFGIRLGKKAQQDITKWQHCWAEFYLPGFGWVPVDPADVRKMMLKQHLKDDDAKTIAYRKYFWGAWDPFRVKLAIGRDLVLTPPQQGAPLNTFGYPYAEVGGKALDFYAPDTFKYSFMCTRIL